MLTLLPVELILKILAFVGARDVAVNVRVVSQYLNSLSHDTQLWQEIRAPFSQPPPIGKTQEFMYMIEHCAVEPFRNVRYLVISPDTYRGEVNSSLQPEGWGILQRVNTPRCAIGEFRAGKLHGTSVLKFDDNELYMGGWLSGQKSGWGEYRWRKDCYIGEWLDDDEHGYGVYKWETGDTYRGSWRSGHKWGYGIHIWGEGAWCGDTYTGYWKNDQQDGFGEYRWNDGRCYVGNWASHQRDGLGMYTLDENNKYIGEWRGGMRHGHGLMITDGVTVSCIWNADMPDSQILKSNTYHRFFTMSKELQRERVAEIKAKKLTN